MKTHGHSPSPSSLTPSSQAGSLSWCRDCFPLAQELVDLQKVFSEPGVVIHGRTCRHCTLAASYPSAVFPPPSVLDLQIHVLRSFLSAAPGCPPVLIRLDPISSEKWVPAVVKSGGNCPAPESHTRVPLTVSQAVFNQRIQADGCERFKCKPKFERGK